MLLPTQTDTTPAEYLSLTPAEIASFFPQLEIIECIGRGGMGLVFKARQRSLNRFVALKLLAPEQKDPAFATRFTNEAQALAAMNHPHIVTVYDFGEAGGFYYLLMEFVDGVNLRQAMAAGRFTPEQALAIVPPVCDALQYAHEHGVVHRDIKPENLLLDKEGRVKIADFGIAVMLEAGDQDIGFVAGTPQYMAPEQKENRRTDHRADIYSLGVVLYEMLTGELPSNQLEPPSRKVQIDVRLDEIVLRALNEKPELRYRSAIEFGTQVKTVAGNPPRPSVPTNPLKPAATNPWARRFFWLLCAFGAFGVIAVITFFVAELRHEVAPDLKAATKSEISEGSAETPMVAQANDDSTAGVGIALSKDNGKLVIGSIIPGSPAARESRLKPGDGILRIGEGDGDPSLQTDTANLDEVVGRLRGRAGTRVSLFVVPVGKNIADGYKVSLTRSYLPPLLEDEVIRLVRERVERTRELYQRGKATMSEVIEAEGELALAASRGNPLKRCEVKLDTATKLLEALELLYTKGAATEIDVNRARQRKLEAQIELERARGAATESKLESSDADRSTISRPKIPVQAPRSEPQR